ncbi:glycosyltransferase [Allohahella marinimesophila]|uniref:Glycosyltransferase subfamily 4-like N-terminal domain-containing protein n=1 Tax=Allohahella marinimesophila TaxID=1054972 RepID=A0ABP7NH39_9GAMM
MRQEHERNIRQSLTILMTTDTEGEVWSYTIDLCEALQAHPVCIELALIGKALSTQQSEQLAALPNVQVHDSGFDVRWISDSPPDIKASGQWLVQLAESLKPDLVHLNHLAYGALSWSCPVLLVGHFCILSWWAAAKNEAAPMPQWAGYKTLLSDSIQKASLLVAPTLAALHSLLSHYGPAERTRVIYNGLSRPETAEPAENEDDEVSILVDGAIWQQDSHLAVLTAISKELACSVYVAGEAPSSNSSERCAEGVTFLGHVSPGELQDRLVRASLYAAPTAYEPLGLGALEAARAGCALLLGDIKNLREVWGDAAVYVAPNDVDALRDKLYNLITRPKRRHYLATAAWARSKRFTTASAAKAYLQSYRSLLATEDETAQQLPRSNAASEALLAET